MSSTALLWVLLLVSALSLVLSLVHLLRVGRTSPGASADVREEFRISRDEARAAGRELREEVNEAIRGGTEQLATSVDRLGAGQKAQLETMATQARELTQATQVALDRVASIFDGRLRELRDGNDQKILEMRKEIGQALNVNAEALTTTVDRLRAAQREQLELVAARVKELTEASQGALHGIRGTLDERVGKVQESTERSLAASRSEIADGLAKSGAALIEAMKAVGLQQQQQLEAMTTQVRALSESSQQALDRLHARLDARVQALQESNDRKLEEMRNTVDGKLQETLERRLGESFKIVSERLEAVHKGLGEMQTLASGVGDLKRVLTNVKARGTWAEVQLGGLLEQVLSPEQFSRNVVVVPGRTEHVEFAIRLPGREENGGSPVWLPIDSKFPQEDYLRLQDAADRADAAATQAALEALGRGVKVAAREIGTKYVSPPHTTDFAIMFLATEGLYAEVIRQPALVDELMREYRIVVAGPTTLTALLNSLRMGFRTLAVQRRASEVWSVLGAVKTEFGKFGSVLSKVKRQLETASRTLEKTGTRTRALTNKLEALEALPEHEAEALLNLPSDIDAGEAAEEDLTPV
ncbi:DNA recombination protein RmuC [Luteitalea sp. TBR-22]|uniref:DNA recombination protein RmuC n=1 Tax=Luteitalea sp. TBR-22 TaxID=2802971 RepID=UPI001EF602B2|nr:DNA recombination protein RmuC [Luteitalea sp. TBR-22]BCS31399.2 DNA recombination protein RmuC [Luteitalea sp. TBR-22]